MDMQVVAWLAAVLVFLSFFMKTIVPLRTLAIVSNIVFIVYALMGLHYGIFDKVLPIFVLHMLLLPLNIIRLKEVRKTIQAVQQMQGEVPLSDILLPFMKHKSAKAGTVLFNKGDRADKVFVIVSGTVHLSDLDKRLSSGDMFGEVAVFSNHARRSSSAVCETDCDFYSISGEKVLELFYLDRQFAFHMAKTLAHYVDEDMSLLTRPLEPAKRV